jgi:hypothetical protein
MAKITPDMPTPRKYFLEVVRTALEEQGTFEKKDVLKTFSPTEQYPTPWAFPDLGEIAKREWLDEGGEMVTSQVQAVAVLAGFEIKNQDTSHQGWLTEASNATMYAVEQALLGIMKDDELSWFEDDFCTITIEGIEIIRMIDGYDQEAQYGQVLVNAEIRYTLSLT